LRKSGVNLEMWSGFRYMECVRGKSGVHLEMWSEFRNVECIWGKSGTNFKMWSVFPEVVAPVCHHRFSIFCWLSSFLQYVHTTIQNKQYNETINSIRYFHIYFPTQLKYAFIKHIN